MNAIAQPLSRFDGRLKVTGAACFAADIPVADADVTHAAIVPSAIANAGPRRSILPPPKGLPAC